MKITSKYLVVPGNFRTKQKKVLFYDPEGKLVYDFDAYLDGINPAFVMYYDVERFKGMDLKVVIEPEMAYEFAQTDERPMNGVYDSYLRPTVHFSAAYGWINDPNGLVYHDGVYHLYFQYNPFAPTWGNMHWGHATSTDLIHWTEQDIGLFPDDTGTMFSGSGICDERNVSGLSPDGKTLMFYYTAAAGCNRLSEGKKYTQRLAYSTDGGKTLVKYDGEPMVDHIVGGNRDPKVVWCEELGCYVMALYTDANEYVLFTSDDLLKWTRIQSIDIPDSSECPDLYPIVADNGERKWVITNAHERYLVGHFDPASRQFVADNQPKKFHYGTHSYAAQTYSGVADRTIKVAWTNFSTDATQFACQMGVPMEISLACIDGEYYMRTLPVAEFDTLAVKTETVKQRAELSQTAAHDITIRAPKDCEDFTFTLFGRTFEVKPKENVFLFTEADKNKMPLSRRGGDIEIRIITDTISMECFLDDGLVYAAFGKILDKNLNYMTVTSSDAEITVKELRSIYEN